MKKFLCLFLLTLCLPSFAAINVKQNGFSTNNYNDDTRTLQNEINRLEKELEQKTERLNKCAAKNKNFQIAGITTLGLTGTGAIANIQMNSQIKDKKKQIDNAHEKIEQANLLGTEFEKDMEKWENNIDEEKIQAELVKELSPEQIQRVPEIFNNLEKIDNLSDLPESDRIIFEKVMNAAYHSQKQPVSQ